MAANAKPLFAKDDIIYAATLKATSENASFPVDYLGDDRLGTWWKAAAAGTIYIYADAGTATAADSIILAGHNLYTADADVSVESGDTFSLTDAFDDSNFDTANFGSAVSGSGTVVETTLLTITSTGASDAALVYDKNYHPDRYGSWQVKHKCRCSPSAAHALVMLALAQKATAPAVDDTADNLKLMIYQDVSGAIYFTHIDTTGTTKYWNPGTSAWQTGSVAAYSGAVATYYVIYLIYDGTTVTFRVYDATETTLHEEATIAMSSVEDDSNPDYFVWGDLLTTGTYKGVMLSTQYQHTGFGITWTEHVAAFTPLDDTAVFKEWASATKRHWRLKIVTASVIPYIGIWMLGAQIELQKYLEDGFDPTPEMPNEEATQTHGGAFVGVVSYSTDLPFKLEFRNLTNAWMLATFDPFWASHMRHPRPIGFVWDKTNHSGEVHVVMRAPGSGKKSPFDRSRRSMSLELAGVVEE